LQIVRVEGFGSIRLFVFGGGVVGCVVAVGLSGRGGGSRRFF